MNIICFHNPNEPYGFLSNWYLCDFTVDDIKYTSTEQYMMYQKAILFNDTEIAEQILSTSDVALIKKLGRKVKNFDEKIWDKNKADIVKEGLFNKFSQNPDLKEKLLETSPCLLAECAVHDRIWGIGLSMTDPNRLTLNSWRGENLLGSLLMMVRDTKLS